MNLKTNLLALLLLIIGTVALNAQTQTPVAVYTGECGSQYYRIPAIVTANNGDLLFFNDDRHTSNKDVGSNTSSNGIDLLVKRLSWNGSAYSSVGASLNITPNKSPLSKCYGDPAVVADRESGEVLVLAIGGTLSWTSNTTSYSIRSHNNGQTWDAPVQMNFGSTNFPSPTDHNVNGFFFASGRILQSKVIKVGSYYRIYVAFLYTTSATASSSTKFNQVYYSDDFGSTWSLLGGAAITSADEAKLEELPNGDVVISSRYEGGRRINKFTYSNRTTYTSGSWGVQGNYPFTGGCAINADMLTMTAYRKSDNQQVTLLLLSTATGSSRTDIKIFYHEIDNNTTVASLTSGWTPTSFTLPNTSVFGGYSAMTLQADDKIGVYYEGNTALCPAAGNDFSNLYYIAYTLEQLTGNAYTLTDPNPPVVVVPDVEVPDGVVPIYEWQGTNSDRWSDPLNWTVINAVNNTPLAPGMVPPTPDENSNVKIEAPGAGEFNPVLETQLAVKNLYVAPGAAIGNQYWLSVSEKVYTDVEIPTNQWVRMSMPLRDTYSGDMYTTTQGGVMPDDEFTAATYNPTEGNNGNNRVFPYAIYQRVFSDAVNVMTDDQTGTEVRQLNSSWSVPYNDLAAKYQVAEGFDLWAPSTEATATFRFPSATDEYAYYYSNGNESTRKESVNHTASGTMAYGNSGNGVMDVTITRNKRSEGEGDTVPMYAVGNPSFSYLDIAEFIRVNAYGASHSGNASVVGNITPYVYKYDEGENLNGGEASETIYYLDNDDKKLHKVTAAVSNTTMPDISTLEDAGRVYVAPTRGFRVMAGQAEVSAVEPKLIGSYNTSTFQIAPLKTSNNSNTLNSGTENTRLHISTYSDNGTGLYNSTLTVSVGSSPDEVIISGLCAFAMVKGVVDPINQTITIAGGSPVSFMYLGGNSWNAISNNSGTTDVKIYAWDGTVSNGTVNVKGKYSQFAGDLNEATPVVLNYTISSDGEVNIYLPEGAGFALYPHRSSDNLASCPGYYLSGLNYPAALNAYTSFSATASRTTDVNAYILPEVFGTYEYQVVGVINTTSETTGASVGTKSFDILPIEGSYNVVKVSGLFEGTSTDLNDVLGYILGDEANGYTLTIPKGQVVANYKTQNFPSYFVVYTKDRSGDLVFDIELSEQVVLKINTYTATPTYGTKVGSIQISHFDANPNSSLSAGYYANGFSGTTTTQHRAVIVTDITELPSNTLLLRTTTNSLYLSQSGTTATNGGNNESTALTNSSYYFTLEPQGDNFVLKSNGGKYFQASKNGANRKVSWTTNISDATLITVSRVGDHWTMTNLSVPDYPYLQLTNNSGFAISNTAFNWDFYKVISETTITTGTSAGQYIPQTAPYSGGSSTTDPTVGQFEVGSNYEAINLKFTAGMFEANPGNNQSASSAPRKSAAQGSTMASVKLVDGDRTANTLITRRDNAKNGFNAFEDASVIDLDNTTKLLATLAGNQVVAVNTLGDTTAVQLYLRNLNGNFTLTFDNLEALGSNARLVDNETGMQTPLNGRHQDLTLSMTVNDLPLRYSIIWDVVSGTEEVELPLTDGDLWFKALSTAKGTIKVVSSENMASVRLYDSTGKLVGSKVNAQNETMFEYLLSGIYVVEVSNGSETQSMKVNVK